MSDPYSPPRADEDGAAPAPPSAWTIRSLLGGMWQAVRRQPLGAFVALFVIPLCWAIPAQWLRARLVPDEWAELGGEPALYVALSSLCVQAWDMICFPGAQLAALRLAAGERIRWREFIEGLRKLPVLLLLSAIVAVPFELIGLLPLPSIAIQVIFIVASLGLAIFWLRTLTWTSLLLLTRWSFWQAFELSWATTRGHSWRLIALFVVLLHVAFPLILVDVINAPRDLPLGMSAFGALMMLAAAQVYVSTPTTGESDSTSTGRKSISRMPPPSAA